MTKEIENLIKKSALRDVEIEIFDAVLENKEINRELIIKILRKVEETYK